MAEGDVRLGVDIGGTFTDLVLEVGGGSDGQRYSTKVLTTYAAPEDAIVDGMHKVCAKAGISADRITQIIHGTTLATNALIERRGAKTALITTEGFRDVIEMRTESRFEQYDLNLKLPEPLLPRYQRYTLKERVGANGDVLIAPDAREIENLAAQIAEAGYESVAIGFLHAYANGAHERAMADALMAAAPDMMVSLSCEVSPQMREYERFNTVVANAYIKPQMKSYLMRLEGRLKGEGAVCPVFLIHSGGGIISLESAAEFPVRLVESGPAGGAVFAADIAARYGLNKVLSFDMGGTTAKICLIENQTPKTSRVFEVARTYRFKKGSGMPISIPVIDMVEIGAGGGSLAHVDGLKQIRVGPESAGSEPGPACYNRGGKRPAVTDADLVLGKLDPDMFAGGSMKLDVAASEEALVVELGAKLDLDAQMSAFGVAEMVDENMANAARVHAVENGEEISDYTMIAFGGAAPLHAGRLSEKLGVQRLLVPPGAGVGSAIGFLRAPFSFEATRSIYSRLSEFDGAMVKELLADLREEATGFVRRCSADEELFTEAKAYMRYSGQGWEIPIVLTQAQASNPDAAEFERLFETHYTALFGRTVEGMDIEITVWAVNVATAVPEQKQITEAAFDDAKLAQTSGQRDLFDAALGTPIGASIVQRADLHHFQIVHGPAIITEDETTIIIPASGKAIAQADGCIDIRFSGERSAAI
ncbi:MAG: hydantoinase/oxoprolinase family protein [Hyphomonadaceae bacterium]